MTEVLTVFQSALISDCLYVYLIVNILVWLSVFLFPYFSITSLLWTVFLVNLDNLAYTFPFIFRCIEGLFIFFSIDKIPRVTSPVLVIHGTEDEVRHINII